MPTTSSLIPVVGVILVATVEACDKTEYISGVGYWARCEPNQNGNPSTCTLFCQNGYRGASVDIACRNQNIYAVEGGGPSSRPDWQWGKERPICVWDMNWPTPKPTSMNCDVAKNGVPGGDLMRIGDYDSACECEYSCNMYKSYGVIGWVYFPPSKRCACVKNFNGKIAQSRHAQFYLTIPRPRPTGPPVSKPTGPPVPEQFVPAPTEEYIVPFTDPPVEEDQPKVFGLRAFGAPLPKNDLEREETTPAPVEDECSADTKRACNKMDGCEWRMGECMAEGACVGNRKQCNAVEGCRYNSNTKQCEEEPDAPAECADIDSGRTCRQREDCTWVGQNKQGLCISNDDVQPPECSDIESQKKCKGMEGCSWKKKKKVCVAE